MKQPPADKEACLLKVPEARRDRMAEDKAKSLADFLKAMSHPTRLQILKLLLNAEYCVCVLSAALEKSQPNISQHLGKLKDNGLVETRQEGKLTFYGIKDGNAREIIRLLK